MRLKTTFARAFAAALIFAGTARADAIPAPQNLPPAAPDERVYTLIDSISTAVSSGTSLTVQFQSSLLRNRETGAVVQCHFMTFKGMPEDVQAQNLKSPTLFVQGVPGGLGLADSLRPAPGADQTSLGSCVPYESPLSPEQLDGKAAGTPPRADIFVGFGTPDKISVAYTMPAHFDPVRERRLEGLYWSEKLKDKPASPLPLVMQ